MKAEIHLERLLNDEEKATDYEAIVYLHTVSLEIPFTEKWYRIYSFLFSKYFLELTKGIDVYRDHIRDGTTRVVKPEEKDLQATNG